VKKKWIHRKKPIAQLADPRIRGFYRRGAGSEGSQTADAFRRSAQCPDLLLVRRRANLFLRLTKNPSGRPELASSGCAISRRIPRVALVIDHYESDWTQLAYVLIHGAARVVEDPKEYMAALPRACAINIFNIAG